MKIVNYALRCREKVHCEYNKNKKMWLWVRVVAKCGCHCDVTRKQSKYVMTNFMCKRSNSRTRWNIMLTWHCAICFSLHHEQRRDYLCVTAVWMSSSAHSLYRWFPGYVTIASVFGFLTIWLRASLATALRKTKIRMAFYLEDGWQSNTAKVNAEVRVQSFYCVRMFRKGNIGN